MNNLYIGLFILASIIAGLGYIYISIFCQTKRYLKKLKQLKKLKLLASKGRKKRGW
jgi:hypothetical protein